MSQEEKITSANYIINFYKEINLLNDSIANYNNILLELQYEYGETSIDKLDLDSKQKLKIMIQDLRYYIQKTKIAYDTIIKSTKKEENTKLNETYQNIMKQFVIDREECRKYCIEINGFLTENITKKLLDTSKTIIDEIYKHDEPKPINTP